MTGDMESSSEECVGTTTPSTQTSIHRAISGTPALQQLLEERTPSTQTIVTRVGFRESFYTVLETTMPMFGSTSRGKSGTASAPEKEDVAASKGTKPKEDADHGAACSDPRHDESTSREMSPQRSPSNLCTREHFALLFGVEVTPTIEDGVSSHILPAYTWTEHISGDLRMVRDQEWDKTLERIWHQYQENGEDGQSTPNCGRGYVCHADRYFAQMYLKKQPERRPGECPVDVRDHHSQSREQGHEGWHVQPGRDRPQGLYAHHETPERAPQGHPLGGGHPERVPQEFCDAFHLAREDQSDTVSGSESETEVEEWDHIIAYDTKTSRYTIVADWEHCRMHDYHRDE